MFGRADAPATDLAFFKANKLDADLIAYRTPHPIAGAERPPNPTSWIDGVFSESDLEPAAVADRIGTALAAWRDSEAPAVTGGHPAGLLPGPRSLHPGNSGGTDRSGTQPRRLDRVPNAQGCLPLLDGPGKRDALWHSNHARELGSHLRLEPKFEFLMNRIQQRATAALNYAIQTTPPPATAADRVELGGLTSSSRSFISSSACVIWLVTVSKRWWTALSPATIRRRCSPSSSSSSASSTRPSRKSTRRSPTSKSSGRRARSTRRHGSQPGQHGPGDR